MEVICEIGICSRERNACARVRARASERENFSEECESNVEQKEKKIGRDVARVIKILLQENVDVLRDRIADARHDSFYQLLPVALVFISHFIIINAFLNLSPIICWYVEKKRILQRGLTLEEFASREDTRKSGRDISDLLVHKYS